MAERAEDGEVLGGGVVVVLVGSRGSSPFIDNRDFDSANQGLAVVPRLSVGLTGDASDVRSGYLVRGQCSAKVAVPRVQVVWKAAAPWKNQDWEKGHPSRAAGQATLQLRLAPIMASCCNVESAKQDFPSSRKPVASSMLAPEGV